MEALAWAIVFTVCVFDYRSHEENVVFTGSVAGISVLALLLLTVASWSTI